MDISGVLVRTYHDNIDAVTRALSRLAGVEVHGANQDGRMVVTIEGESGREAADLLVLRRLIDSLEVPAVVSPTGAAIAIDETRVGSSTPRPQRATSIWWTPWLPMSPLPVSQNQCQS